MKKYTVIMVVALILGFLVGVYLYKINYKKNNNEEMKIAAAKALASLVSDEELSADYIIPKPFDPRVGKTVAAAVAQAARDSGVARI